MNPTMRLLYVLIAVAAFGCGDPSARSEPDKQPASVSFSILWQTPPPEDPDVNLRVERYAPLDGCPVEKVQCKVYGDNDEELTVHTWPCADHGGTIDDIPPGLNRKFVVFGLDGNDRIIFRGQAAGGYDFNPGEQRDIGRIEPTLFVPLLSNSVDGTNYNVLNPTLIWDAVDGASEYNITVSENSDFANLIIDAHTQDANYKVSGLNKAKTYHFRVYAADAYNNMGKVSEIRSFIVDAITLPDTGQTKNYTDTPGEDSDYNINPPTYTKLDKEGHALDADATPWAMVRDETTGLIWEVKTDDNGTRDKDNRYTWQNSKDNHIAELNSARFGGYDHWRLPTIRELSTLVNYDHDRPPINPTYFPITEQDAWYWSSDQPVDDNARARIVAMDIGRSFYILKTEPKSVLAVYSGQTNVIVNPVFEDHGDGTVTDKRTGLMWQKEADKQLRTWEAALQYCEELELAGHNDWRMPNVRELQSIINYDSLVAPYIYAEISGALDLATDNYFWSSTSLPDPSVQDAWIVKFNVGNIENIGKTNTGVLAHPVRGGQ